MKARRCERLTTMHPDHLRVFCRAFRGVRFENYRSTPVQEPNVVAHFDHNEANEARGGESHEPRPAHLTQRDDDGPPRPSRSAGSAGTEPPPGASGSQCEPKGSGTPGDGGAATLRTEPTRRRGRCPPPCGCNVLMPAAVDRGHCPSSTGAYDRPRGQLSGPSGELAVRRMCRGFDTSDLLCPRLWPACDLCDRRWDHEDARARAPLRSQ